MRDLKAVSRQRWSRRGRGWVIAGVCSLALVSPAGAEDRVWTATSGYWTNGAHWAGGTAPNAGDQVFITNASAQVLLDGSSPVLGSLTLSKTLIFTNWSTILTATNMTILNGGTVTVANAFTTNQMSNRVYVVCETLTVNAGGRIDVSARGYAGVLNEHGQGPGRGTGITDGSGGGYGGGGGLGVKTNEGGAVYGTASEPTDPGSSGAGSSTSPGGHGGGAVRIEAAGAVVVNGSILANGQNGSGSSWRSGGGAGGSIYIQCQSFSAPSTGAVLQVNGGDGTKGNTSTYQTGGGGGGRIALIYSSLDATNVGGRFSARMGIGAGGLAGMGTLFLSNTNLMTESLTVFDHVRLVIPNFSAWTTPRLSISNSVVALGTEFLSLTVSSDLTITNGGLMVGGLALTNGHSVAMAGGATNPGVTVGGHLRLLSGGVLTLGLSGEASNILLNVVSNGWLDGGVLAVGATNQGPYSGIDFGDGLFLTNGASLRLYSGRTNDAVGFYGAGLTATGGGATVTIGPGCWIHPHAQATNGGAVILRAGALFIATNGGINADEKGYSGVLNANGWGPGKGWSGNDASGAGHGGQGGRGASVTTRGAVYGRTNAPVAPGSGGGGTSQAAGGAGGGGIWIEVVDRVTLNGSIRANGGNGGGVNYRSGGGSGGSLFIRCLNFGGDATGAVLQAQGGDGSKGNVSTYQSGAGGGGRIAVALNLSTNDIAQLRLGLTVAGMQAYQDHAAYAGGISVTGGVGYTTDAAPGTVRFLTTQHLVTVTGTPARRGHPGPDRYGITPYPNGASVTNRVMSPDDESQGTRQSCLGWLLTDDQGGPQDQAGTTQAVFTVTTNLILTWRWTNEYQLTVWAATNGSVNALTVNGWYTDQTAVAGIEATPDAGYAFMRWVGSDVPTGMETNNPLTVTMDRPRTLTAAFYSVAGATKRWNGVGDWYAAVTNWSPANPPGPTDTAIIQSGRVLLAETVALLALTVSNSAILMMTNWNTRVEADEIVIRPQGTITVAGAFTTNQMSNRVWLVCGTMTVQEGGCIDVSGKGYIGVRNDHGQGPGRGVGITDGPGAGYGGKGGEGTKTNEGGVAYGMAAAPTDPGSSGAGSSDSPGANGGGVVRIEATGRVTMNGAIWADGSTYDVSGSYRAAGGAGGSIFIDCREFGGTAAGAVMRAHGGHGAKGNTGTYQSGAGGGGRVTVWLGMTDADRARVRAGDLSRVTVTNRSEDYAGTISVTNGLGYRNPPDARAAAEGTVRVIEARPANGLMIQIL